MVIAGGDALTTGGAGFCGVVMPLAASGEEAVSGPCPRDISGAMTKKPRQRLNAPPTNS